MEKRIYEVLEVTFLVEKDNKIISGYVKFENDPVYIIDDDLIFFEDMIIDEIFEEIEKKKIILFDCNGDYDDGIIREFMKF